MPAFPPLPQAINPLVQVQTWQPTQPWIDYFNGLDGLIRPISGSSGGGVVAAPFDALAYNGMQINGSMEVSQENGTTAQTATSKYIVDGFLLFFNGTMVVSAAQIADAPSGLTNSIKITVGTAQASIGAGDFTFTEQFVEGYRSSRLVFGTANAQSISIGFWSKIHRPGTYSGSLRNSALTRSYVFTFIQNVADAWEYKTVTIPGDTSGVWIGNTNGIGLGISFSMAAGSTFQTVANAWTAGNFLAATGTTNGVAATTDTFQVTGVVILPGIEVPSAARSPFIMRPFTEEIGICQRYYYKRTSSFLGYVNAAGNPIGLWSPHPVQMRAAPSIVGSGGTMFGTTAGGTLVFDQITADGLRAYILSLSGPGTGGIDNFLQATDARL